MSKRSYEQLLASEGTETVRNTTSCKELIMSENVSAESPSKVSAARFGGKGVTVAIVVAAILTVGGLALWAFQLTSGMVNTNMRNLDSWGFITMFMFLVGLSAGGLIISSAPRVFSMEGFGGVSKIAVWTSICCTVLAIGFVVIDLGQPLRLWELFVYSISARL